MGDKRKWRRTKPPDGVEVEVHELDGRVILATPVFGGDGYRPHWRHRDGTCADADYYREWRPRAKQP